VTRRISGIRSRSEISAQRTEDRYRRICRTMPSSVILSSAASMKALELPAKDEYYAYERVDSCSRNEPGLYAKMGRGCPPRGATFR
jgi:hypothetical protein